MAIEIIPKLKTKPPLWKRILSSLLLFLLIGMVSVYFILCYLIKKSEAKLQDLNSNLAKEIIPEQRILEEELIPLRDKIEDFELILNSRRPSLKFFEFLESHTHPKVRWKEFSLDLDELSMELSGETENFTTLEQQFLILKEEKLVEKIKLFDISTGEEGKVYFSLKFSFSPEI